MPVPPRKIVIYQILTRLFGNRKTVNKTHGTIDENGVGKFNDINPAALDGIKSLGATHIWYTGIIEHATLTSYTAFGIAEDDPVLVKGMAGSPYAIKDYYDVNPDLATHVPDRMKEFEQLVDRTHQHQLKVVIDFVPNHVARGYRSDAKPAGVKDLGEEDDITLPFHPHNNFYYLPGEVFKPPRRNDVIPNETVSRFKEQPAKVTGNDQFTASPGIEDWFETVKLNYGVDIQSNRTAHFHPIPATWEKMHDILLFWTNKKIDGFRCDMAEMVPVEFWQWVIPRIKAVRPEIIFIAEIYNPAQYRTYIERGQFDFLYDKVLLYDTLRLLTSGHKRTEDIHAIRHQLERVDDHMLHFMENHDEQRVASEFFAGNPWRALPAMVISAMIDRGAVMIYFGQEVGETGSGAGGFQTNDGRTTIFDYWGVPEHQKWMNDGKFDGGGLSPEQKKLRMFYAQLLTLASRNIAVSSGACMDITSFNVEAGNINERVHAFVRFYADERLLIVNSFSDRDLTVNIQLPAAVFVQMGLDEAREYVATELLWGEVKVRIARNLISGLVLKPYSSFIFRISDPAQ